MTMTLFILEYQAKNDGSASALPPLGYTVSNQVFQHGHEVAEE